MIVAVLAETLSAWKNADEDCEEQHEVTVLHIQVGDKLKFSVECIITLDDPHEPVEYRYCYNNVRIHK